MKLDLSLRGWHGDQVTVCQVIRGHHHCQKISKETQSDEIKGEERRLKGIKEDECNFFKVLSFWGNYFETVTGQHFLVEPTVPLMIKNHPEKCHAIPVSSFCKNWVKYIHTKSGAQ